MVGKPDVVVDDLIDGPWVIFRHRRRFSESPHVGANDPKASRQKGHPTVPSETILRITVQEKGGLGSYPRIGQVVVPVEHRNPGRKLELRHATAPFPSERSGRHGGR